MKQLKITFEGLAKRQPLVSVGNQWVYSISDIITTVFVTDLIKQKYLEKSICFNQYRVAKHIM